MKVPLLTLAAVTCTFALQANAQKVAPTNPTTGTSYQAQLNATKSLGVGRTGASSNFVSGGSDTCATATAIAGPGAFPGDNLGATNDGPANCGLMGSDVWYNWTAGATGNTTFQLCGSTYDTVITVYDTAACVGLMLACNDDFCGLQSQVTVPTTSGNVYKIQVGGFASGQGTYILTILPPAPPATNDDCTMPTVLGPTGPYNFDNSGATTGVQGQTEGACLFYGSTTVDNDVWFTWTAPSSGSAQLTTCGLTAVDTKIAVYAGSGCPAGAAIACNDDACPGFQSTICFPVTGAATYTIQLGCFPGAAGGVGQFDITVSSGGNPCTKDDGSTENLLGWTAGGEMAWLEKFGTVGTTSVSNVQVAWGSAAYPGFGPGNGSAAKVCVYEDPNDDGDPTDGVLVALVNTTVQNVDTDTFNTVAIPTANLSGVFFLGAGLAHAGGQYVAPMDQTSCTSTTDSWFFGNNNATPIDYVNITNNAQLPASFANIGYPCNVMVRGGCNLSPFTSYCHPGVDAPACPCSNPPTALGRGCNNFGTGPADSARMQAAGTASLSADTLVMTIDGENNTSTTIFMQGTSSIPGTIFGAGIRCIGGTLKRLYTGPASGGTIVRPGMGDPSVSARSAALGNPISAGQSRYYMGYYRDPGASGPCANSLSTYNSSQSNSCTWAP